MVWMRVTKKRIALVVALALIASIAYCARGVDRVAVIAGHGYIIPSEYPGGAYGSPPTPLKSFATAVMWPSMEPLTRETAKRQSQDRQEIYGNCDYLKISVSEKIIIKEYRRDEIVMKRYRDRYIDRKTISEEFGMKMLTFSPNGRNVSMYDNVYVEKEKDDREFVAECTKIGRYPSPQCEMSFSINDRNLYISIDGGLSCLEFRHSINEKIVNLIEEFSKLYKEKY